MSDLLVRMLMAPIVFLAVTIGAFALPGLAGVDPASAALRARFDNAEQDPTTLARVRAELGLDRPAPVRYAEFLSRAARGDLGVSTVSRRPVGPQVLRATVTSLTMVAVAIGLALAVAVPTGVATARRAGGRFDAVWSVAARVTVSVPVIVLAPVLVLGLGVHSGILPTSGWGTWRHLVLPVACLAAVPTALFSQLVRAEMVDTLAQPYVVTARSKGVPERVVVWRHALRMALATTVSLAGMFFAGLVGGAVLVEVIFGIPGLGRLLHGAVLNADVPLLQGGLLAAVGVALVVGLAADTLSRLLAPAGRGS